MDKQCLQQGFQKLGQLPKWAQIFGHQLPKIAKFSKRGRRPRTPASSSKQSSRMHSTKARKTPDTLPQKLVVAHQKLAKCPDTFICSCKHYWAGRPSAGLPLCAGAGRPSACRFVPGQAGLRPAILCRPQCSKSTVQHNLAKNTHVLCATVFCSCILGCL